MLNATPQTIEADALMSRIAKGDRSALARLFEAEAGRLIGVAMRIVRRRDLAEDIVQEVFVTIWQRAAQFDTARGTARGWLTTSVRNRALNTVRDGARMDYHDTQTLAELGDATQDASTIAANAYDQLAERDALKACLAQLDEPKRRAILMCYVSGLSHGEVAATLKAPLGTVKAWIRRGVIALQECLA